MSKAFNPDEFLPRSVMARICDVRVNRPEAILKEAQERRRRERLTLDGKLAIVATDHPGRGVTRIGDDPLRMGDRWEYLARALRVLLTPGFDGIMGTPDFLEDVLIINLLVRESGGPSFLDGKVLVGCMQRGGVAGIVGEIDDRFGAYTPESLEQMRFDGGKFMFRAVPSDERSLNTIDYCARAITELSRRGLYSFAEPLPMKEVDGRYVADYTVENLVKYVSVTAALGETSRYTWLKIPYIPDYGRVTAATSLPILMLGGDSKGDPVPIIKDFANGMAAGPNVRGVLVGRNLTFPGELDPYAPARAVARIVHEGVSLEDALSTMEASSGRDMDVLTRWLKA